MKRDGVCRREKAKSRRLQWPRAVSWLEKACIVTDKNPSFDWLTDRVIEVSQESDFLRRRAESAAFRLDQETPYLRLHFVGVYVSDQERSLRFFVDQLGFSAITDVRFASGHRWIEVSPPDGTAVLALIPARGVGEEHLVGNSGLCTFLCEDVERTYREWSRRGVQFTIPPHMPAWGGTFARFEDPDGNPFGLAGFTELTRDIDERRRAYAEKLEAERGAAQELEIAKQVQARLFPQRLPVVADLDYAGVCVQARSVGGDYYDFLESKEGRLALIVGDIAGKGIAAALLMANLQANLRSQFVAAADDPESFLVSVNQLLFENTAASAYATLFFADYDWASGRLAYANCGHVPGLVVRADGAVEQLDSNCTVVGLFERWACRMHSAELGRGDLVALYTDGITESCNSRGEEFGQERLIEVLRGYAGVPAQQLVAAAVERVVEFSAGRQVDDLTLIVARRTGG